jgi:DNA polymerase III gamma/tau subunit
MWVLGKNQKLITRYRPKNLSDVRGNKDILQFLKNKLSGDRAKIPRNYLLFGNSGCGKTSIAMAFGREIGCPPLIEHRNGQEVEILYGFHSYSTFQYLGKKWEKIIGGIYDFMRVRNLFGAKPVVYLFDEAQDLPKKARATLYQILEHPAHNAFFFFCTTDKHLVRKDDPFRRRVAMFEIMPLSQSERIDYIKWICKEEHKALPKDEIKRIARDSDGAPGEILSMLDEAFVRF